MGLLGAGEVGGGKGRTPLPARCSYQHSHTGGQVIFQGVIQALTAEEFSTRAEVFMPLILDLTPEVSPGLRRQRSSCCNKPITTCAPGGTETRWLEAGCCGSGGLDALAEGWLVVSCGPNLWMVV